MIDLFSSKGVILKPRLEIDLHPFRGVSSIQYSISETIFGRIFILSSEDRIIELGFEDFNISEIEKKYHSVNFQEKLTEVHNNTVEMINGNSIVNQKLQLTPKGTDFQIQVWQELLKISFGETATYQQIANNLKMKNGARAVGTAIGSNPIAYLIPCHRVISSSGKLTGFKWGLDLKRKLLIRELA